MMPKKTRKIPGKNFLHTHPFREAKYKMKSDHVIVDREDWELAIEILAKPKNLKALNDD